MGFGFGLGLGLPPRPGVAEDAPIVVTLAVDYEKSFARGLRPSGDPGRKQLHFRMDTAARSPRAAPQGTALTSRAPSPEPQQRASPSTLRPRSLLFRPSAWVLVVAQHRLRPTVQGRVLHPPSGQPRRVATRAGTHAARSCSPTPGKTGKKGGEGGGLSGIDWPEPGCTCSSSTSASRPTIKSWRNIQVLVK